MFAVVDVETTGGHASAHGMTEIAIVLYNGSEVVDRYSTLLNPKCHIPLSIQMLTGITPEMVEQAPCFEEVAEEVRSFLGDHTFVAHNVNFDYAFVRAAFTACNIEYNPKRLCSVRYARKIEKGLRSYALGALCKHFNVRNQAAHRGYGDAEGTAEILGILLEKDTQGEWQQLIKKNSGEFNLPAHLDSEDYHSLPEAPGVYYFLDKAGKPLYIGKARNLKKRVATHFITNKETKRSQAFKREIYNITYERTGSELLAGLLEDSEIRHHWPIYNRAQKKPKRRFAVYAYPNQNGSWCLAVNKVTSQNGFLREFHTHHGALSWVYKMVERFRLDPSRCGFPHSTLPMKVTGEEHDERMQEFLDNVRSDSTNYVIKTPGREQDEEGFAYIEGGKLAGIGFVPSTSEVRAASDLRDYLRELRSSITTQGIIEKVLEERKYQVWRL